MLRVLGSYPSYRSPGGERAAPLRHNPRDTRVSHRPNPLTTGPSRAPARAMLKAAGFSDADLKKPLIGVANTWIEIGPCNLHLRTLADDVKDGIRAAGGTPMEFNTVSISDGITMGTEGMRASLVSREVIADSIELVARGNGFDGLVVLVGCDKTIPGRRHGAGASEHAGPRALRRIDCARTVPGPPGHRAGRVRGGRRARRRQDDRPGVQDARGRRVPGRRRVRRPVHRQHDGDRVRSARHLAARQRQRPGDRRRRRRTSAQRSARWPSRSPGNELRPRDIITKRAIENAIAVVSATGGSTNAVLHLLAIAHEAGVELELADFDRISAKTPVIADLKPSGRFVATELHAAGGSPLVIKRLVEGSAIDGDAPTVTGRTLAEEAAAAPETAGPGGRAAGRRAAQVDTAAWSSCSATSRRKAAC